MAYRIDCTEDDGFVVQSEDDQEVVEFVKQHARQKHDMEMSDDEAREMMVES